MLKQSVAFTDFDDNERVETLYFNLTKTELADNLDMKSEFENLQTEFTGENKRELEVEEIRKILELVKKIMRLSYGIRSSDGKRFIKTPEQWEEFTQTAAYDQFLYSLFVDPNQAVAFITGILPKDLREEATKRAGLPDARVAQVMAAQKAQAEKAEASTATPPSVQTVELPSNDQPPTMSNPPTEAEVDAMLAWMNKKK